MPAKGIPEKQGLNERVIQIDQNMIGCQDTVCGSLVQLGARSTWRRRATPSTMGLTVAELRIWLHWTQEVSWQRISVTLMVYLKA